MAYSELIKDFKRIRSYMRAFYVYGFRTRSDYTEKSARSYDNERRRIGSWLGEYLRFYQDAEGRRSFLAVDCRKIPRNPLYRAFHAKSFTTNDIDLHFTVLDVLADGRERSPQEIAEEIDLLLADSGADWIPDESTLRKKLKEYTRAGMLEEVRRGRSVCYRITDSAVPMDQWKSCIEFYSEAAPLGVIGSYLLDRYPETEAFFSFKHHYILYALDSEILLSLLRAIRSGEQVVLTLHQRSGTTKNCRVFPLKIYHGTQTGRQYLCGWNVSEKGIRTYRLDHVVSCKTAEPPEPRSREDWQARYEEWRKHVFGVAARDSDELEHVEFTVRAEPWEYYIVQRLEREKRCGTVERVDAPDAGSARVYRYSADVLDSGELIPWVRTFTGRLLSFECSNPKIRQRFLDGIAEMRELYGVPEAEEVDHAVQ